MYSFANRLSARRHVKPIVCPMSMEQCRPIDPHQYTDAHKSEKNGSTTPVQHRCLQVILILRRMFVRGCRLQFTDEHIWLSLCHFVAALSILVPEHTLSRLRPLTATSPALCEKVCKLVPFLGGRPLLHPGLRSRPEAVANAYWNRDQANVHDVD